MNTSANGGFGIWYAVDIANSKSFLAYKSTLRNFEIIHNDGFSFSCFANQTQLKHNASDTNAEVYGMFIPVALTMNS